MKKLSTDKTGMIARGYFSGFKYQVETPRCKALCQRCGEEADQLFQSQPGIVCLMVCRQCKAEEKK